MPLVGHGTPSSRHFASYVTWATRVPRCRRYIARQKKAASLSAIWSDLVQAEVPILQDFSGHLRVPHKGPADTELADHTDLPIPYLRPSGTGALWSSQPSAYPKPETHSACCLGEFIGHLRELVIAQEAEHEGIQVAGNHAAQAGVRHPPGNRRHYGCRRTPLRNSGIRKSEVAQV